ncbi:hypothetical protein [Fischerella sp. PCC 9605]|uniref:hypothetical protein n=1 Tax=Fischerella sp. PCC 9605 TaxID=1173024 RepID=UPI00047BC205|nr:hypothetical protein [Fischerella sp. PCC 9605]
MELVIILLGIAVIIGVVSWVVDKANKAQLYTKLKPRLDQLDQREARFSHEQAEWGRQVQQQQAEWARKVQEDKQAIETLAREKSLGFPWLAQAYTDFYYLQDIKKAEFLELKSHPAKKAAETIREIAAERRKAEKLWRVLKYQLEY